MPRRSGTELPDQGRRPAQRAAAEALLLRARHLRSADAEVLLAYLSERQRARLAHLLAGCVRCQTLVKTLLQPPVSAAPRRTADEQADELYRAADFLHASARQLEADADRAEAAVEDLLAAPARERRRRIRSEVRFQSLTVACRLLHRAFAAGIVAPAKVERLALLALAVLARLDPEAVPSLAIGEMTADCWALVARARWEREDWPGVRAALDAAEAAMVEHGSLAPWPEFRAAVRALRVVERRLAEAVAAGAHTLHMLLAQIDIRQAVAVAAMQQESGHDHEPAPAGAPPERPNPRET